MNWGRVKILTLGNQSTGKPQQQNFTKNVNKLLSWQKWTSKIHGDGQQQTLAGSSCTTHVKSRCLESLKRRYRAKKSQVRSRSKQIFVCNVASRMQNTLWYVVIETASLQLPKKIPVSRGWSPQLSWKGLGTRNCANTKSADSCWHKLWLRQTAACCFVRSLSWYPILMTPSCILQKWLW